MTLDQLPAAYARACALAVSTAEQASEQRCRYCGKHWVRWPGSKLDGHSRCVVGIEFQREVFKLYRGNIGVSVRVICEALGLTPSVVGSWIRNVEKVDRS